MFSVLIYLQLNLVITYIQTNPNQLTKLYSRAAVELSQLIRIYLSINRPFQRNVNNIPYKVSFSSSFFNAQSLLATACDTFHTMQHNPHFCKSCKTHPSMLLKPCQTLKILPNLPYQTFSNLVIHRQSLTLHFIGSNFAYFS